MEESPNNSPPQSLIGQEDDLYYFESDHLALKGNEDYSEILKTIFILQALQQKTIEDYTKVCELRKKAIENPEMILEKLEHNEPLGVPEIAAVPEVPTIDWSKYPVNLPEEALKVLKEMSDNKVKKESHKVNKTHAVQENTHNKPWTVEEQRRLEELLYVYPSEGVELHRFKKIAAALGNRSVKQVTSRVQKYFIKLYKAGLPIPGRIPKYAERNKKSKLHLHQKNNHYLFKPTTFFPQFNLPVVINEAEDIPGPACTDYPIPTTSKNSNYLMLDSTYAEHDKINDSSLDPKDEINLRIQLLKQIKADKQDSTDLQKSYQHFNFKCDYCKEEPIVGTRWHCTVCNKDSIDFCSDCVISQMETGISHPITHELVPIRLESRGSRMGHEFSDETMSTYTNNTNRNTRSDSENSMTSDGDTSEEDTIKEEPQFMLEDQEFDGNEHLYGMEVEASELYEEHDNQDFYSNIQNDAYSYLRSVLDDSNTS